MATSEIADRFITELARVLGALLETETSIRPAAELTEPSFVVSMVADGRAGEVRVHFVRADAEALAKATTGSAVEPSETTVHDTLREICAQAAASLDQGPAGAALSVASVQLADQPPDPSATTAVEIVMAALGRTLRLGLSGTLEPASTVERGQPARSQTLDVILDIELPLVVRFGRTELPLRTLTTLGPGSVVDLGRSPDAPVDVLISNRVVARGEVVIVSGNYGVRIRDVISPAERARSLEVELA